MKILFDPEKSISNQKKHGVPLALASQLDWDQAWAWVDNRFDYDENRMAALAPIQETLYYVAFIERDDAFRIISLRRATRREVKFYVDKVINS